MHQREEYFQKLLVEGNDDQHVIWALCKHYVVAQSFDVVSCDGINRLFEQLPVRFKQGELKAVGLVIDADEKHSQRWQSLHSILGKVNINLPELLPEEGFIVDSSDIRFGVWLMPDNQSYGMLEDFIKYLIPNEDPLITVVQRHVDDTESANIHKFLPAHKSKAVIHGWLALQEDPGTPMGLAITKRYFSPENEQCARFINWLNRMFNQ